MAGVESLRFCIPFSYRAMYKCLLIIIIIINRVGWGNVGHGVLWDKVG